jgi:hypothetical protein
LNLNLNEVAMTSTAGRRLVMQANSVDIRLQQRGPDGLQFWQRVPTGPDATRPGHSVTLAGYRQAVCHDLQSCDGHITDTFGIKTLRFWFNF